MITVILEDFEGLQAQYPLVIEVTCPDVGLDNPLCVTDDGSETVQTVSTFDTTTDKGITTVNSSDSTTTVSDTFFEPDYETKEIKSIEDSVDPADAALEDDDDFVDVVGVISPE